MKIPETLRDETRRKLWSIADDINWLSLTIQEKAKYYESWTTDKNFGGVLGRYMDAREIRMYIKDMLMRPYSHEKFQDEKTPMKLLHMPSDLNIVESYVSPFGRLFENGEMIFWGQAKDWRSIFMSSFERAYMEKKKIYGIVLFNVNGKFCENIHQEMIRSASKKLGINNLKFVSFSK